MPTSQDPFSANFSQYLNLPVGGTIELYNTVTKKYGRKGGFDENYPLPAKEGFTFACDPEGFIFYRGKPVPASGIIPGTKEEPHPVIGGAISVDGMAAEFNIDPVNNYEDWENNISGVIAQLETYLPKGHELRFVPTAEFSKARFDAAPERDKELGCQPDFNAWDGGVNPPPEPTNPYLRCAGGHLHVGWTENEDLSDIQHLLNCQDLVKQFDWYLGGWSLRHDDDNIRRSMYGKMGACRFKDYGVEYRVLSNFWLTTRELRLETWNRMQTAIASMAGCYLPDRASKEINDKLKNSLNNSVMDTDLIYLGAYPLFTLNPGQLAF